MTNLELKYFPDVSFDVIEKHIRAYAWFPEQEDVSIEDVCAHLKDGTDPRIVSKASLFLLRIGVLQEGDKKGRITCRRLTAEKGRGLAQALRSSHSDCDEHGRALYWKYIVYSHEQMKDWLRRLDGKPYDSDTLLKLFQKAGVKSLHNGKTGQQAAIDMFKTADLLIPNEHTKKYKVSPFSESEFKQLKQQIKDYKDQKANLAELSSPLPKLAADLRSHLETISDTQILSFVEEAIKCLEAKLYRAAVVLSWIGAVSVLYECTLTNHLSEFNVEAVKRDSKWKNAKTRDDLARMKESDFLDVLEKISVLGGNVKQELKKSLDLRNGCGHPNSLQIGDSIVAAHIELLILNVFSRFNI